MMFAISQCINTAFHTQQDGVNAMTAKVKKGKGHTHRLSAHCVEKC